MQVLDAVLNISIHALREEGDISYRQPYFLVEISIHALREEGDRNQVACHSILLNFYPRPPRGGRQLEKWEREFWFSFLSTPSARRATLMDGIDFYQVAISIHALREEGDVVPSGITLEQWDFYPRPPRGGRRSKEVILRDREHFYPRPPRGGRPNKRYKRCRLLVNFYPRPPRGGRRWEKSSCH